MLPYIMLALSPLGWKLIANSLYKNSNNHEYINRFVIVATGISLFLMIGLRSKELGSTDSRQYCYYWELLHEFSFEELVSYSKDSRLEIGFLGSVWLLSHIPLFAPSQYIFVISGFVISFCVCKFIYRYCDDVTLGLTMYICLGLYTFMVQGLRQAIAMSICMLAVRYCIERKLLKFILMVLLASLFHQTAIVFCIVYFLYGLNLEMRTLLHVSILCIIMAFFSTKIIDIMNSFFGMKYGIAVESGGFVAVAIYLIILILCGLLAGDNKKDLNYCFFFYLTLLGFSVYVVRYIGALAAERISFYFMIGQLISLPSTLRSMDAKSKKLLKIAIMGLSFLLFAYRLNGSNLLPYHFFWQ